jgi:hypothetical protein
VKYKKTTVDGVLHPDIYQTLAYAVAADLPGALLVYAAGGSDPVYHRVVHLDRRIDVMALELDGPRSAVLADVERVADDVRLWRGRAAAAPCLSR